MGNVKAFIAGVIAAVLVLTPIGAGIVRARIVEYRTTLSEIRDGFGEIQKSIESAKSDAGRAGKRAVGIDGRIGGIEADLTDLTASFGELRNESRLLLMELATLESSIASLQARAESLSMSLKSFDRDLKRARNRATGALVVSIAAGVLAAGVTVWLVAREK